MVEGASSRRRGTERGRGRGRGEETDDGDDDMWDGDDVDDEGEDDDEGDGGTIMIGRAPRSCSEGDLKNMPPLVHLSLKLLILPMENYKLILPKLEDASGDPWGVF